MDIETDRPKADASDRESIGTTARDIQTDWKRFSDGRTAFVFALITFFLHPGFRAVVFYRIAHFLEVHGVRLLPQLLHNASLMTTGAEIFPGAKIGPGLLVHHPAGVVIGCGSRIGRNCTVLPRVTVGEKYSPTRSEHLYPTIADHVILGAGSVLLGAIKVGSYSIIGANAVVTKDVPERSVATGVPARVRPILADKAN